MSSLAGSLYGLRKESRSLADFSDGIAWLHTRRQNRDFAVLIPLRGFLSFFSDLKDVGARISTKGNEVVAKWQEYNKDRPKGQRRPIGWITEICRYEWRGIRGKIDRTIFELQINSYAATAALQHEDDPQIVQGDLKILIKARTTVILDERPDKTGRDAEGMWLGNKGELFFLKAFFHCSVTSSL
jgi:hypothetical protein